MMSALLVITKIKALFFPLMFLDSRFTTHFSQIMFCKLQLITHDLSFIQSNIIITKDTAS